MTTHTLIAENGYLYAPVQDYDGAPKTPLIILYEAGDCDMVREHNSPRRILRALYDLYQTHDGLEEGDEFAMPDGTVIAYCTDIHVLAMPVVEG